MALFDRFLQPGKKPLKTPTPVTGGYKGSSSSTPYNPKTGENYMGVSGARDMLSRTSDNVVSSRNLPSSNSFGPGTISKQPLNMATPKPQAQIQAVKPKTLPQSMPLSTTSYGQNTLKQPSNFFAKPQVVGPSGKPMSSVPQMSVAPKLTLEQMQAKNQALRQSQGRTQGQVQASNGPVVAPKLPPPPQPYGGQLNPSDPAYIGGQQMNQTLGTQIPNQPMPELPPPSSQNLRTEFKPEGPSQLDILRKNYLDSLGLSPEEQQAQAELSGISGTAAQESAKARQEYADRIKAIQDQATLQPFLTGRQIQASGQLTNQLEALKASTEAQTIPLQDRLTALQAQREMERKRRETELGFAQSDREAEQVTPVEVGGRLVNPRTGEVIFEAPEKADLPTLAQEFQFAQQNGFSGGFLDFIQAKQKSESGSGGDKVLSPTEAAALGVPYGTTESQAYGQFATGKPTVEESKARQFAVTAENADKILADINYDPGLIEVSQLPNVFKSSQRQQFEQASRAFVNATLRRESGATITDDEFKNKYKELIPQAGDSAAVKQQKAAARAAAVQSIKEAGRMGTQGGGAGIQNGIIVDPNAFLDSF